MNRRLLKKIFIHDRYRRQRHRQREKHAPFREPDVGLNPWSPGSRPRAEAEAQLLSHPDVQDSDIPKQLHTWGKLESDCVRQGKGQKRSEVLSLYLRLILGPETAYINQKNKTDRQ